MSYWKQVCKYPKSVDIDFGEYISDTSATPGAPIDQFFDRCRELVVLHGQMRDDSDKEELVSHLVIAATVGACEELFRDIFDLLTSNCPVSKSYLFQNEIKIELLQRYSQEDICRAFTQYKSLTSSKKVNNTCEDVTGLNIRNEEELQIKLNKFEKVSNLRHAAIHARGILGHGNLSSLLGDNLDVSIPSQLITNIDNVHTVIEFAMSLGRQFNRRLFVRTVERWIAESTLHGDWQSDKKIVKPIVEGFYSTFDKEDSCNAKEVYEDFLPMST